jgi:hypothetical protein
MHLPVPTNLIERRQFSWLLASLSLLMGGGAWSKVPAASDAAASQLAYEFLDLVDAGKGEEAISRFVAANDSTASSSSSPSQSVRNYLAARLGIGSLSNRRLIEVKRHESAIRVLVRYNAPESPRQGTNNRKLARHNEFIDLIEAPTEQLKISGFGFAD